MPLGRGCLSPLKIFNTTINGLPFAPPFMKSRHGYVVKEKDLLSIVIIVGALRKSLVETGEFSLV